MAQLILVDTDILIDTGRKVTAAVGYLEHMEQQTTLGISAITQMELMVGCRNKAIKESGAFSSDSYVDLELSR